MSREQDLPDPNPHAMEPEDLSPEEVSRRKLLKLGIGALGCGLALVPVVPALGYLVHPLNKGTGEAKPLVPAGKRANFGVEPVRVDLYRTAGSLEPDPNQAGSAGEQRGKLKPVNSVAPAAVHSPGTDQFRHVG